MNKEKYHKGRCQLTQASFTKIHKRFNADIEEVFGSGPYPDELQRAIEAIKKGEPYNEDPYEHKSQYWFNGKGCIVKVVQEFHVYLGYDDSERTVKPEYEYDWWIFEREYYEKHFAGQTIQAEDFAQLDEKVNFLKSSKSKGADQAVCL